MAAAFQDIINSMLQPEEDPEIMFTDEADALPSSDPATKMHIIDLEHFNGNLDYGDPGTLNLWDCVATLLFHISPDTLSKFLDPDTTVFRLQIEPKSAHQSTLVIWKHGKDMMVAEFTPGMFDGDSVYEWDNILRCKSKNGDWKYVSGTYGGISAPIVEQAWLGNLINLGNLFRLTGAKASELAQCLGIRMLINGMWDEKSHDWTLKVERKTDAAE